MQERPAQGRALFYTRDSEGKAEFAPPQYVVWANSMAVKHGLRFTGTPSAIESMIQRGISAEGDVFLDYGVSGNLLSRPGLNALFETAKRDRTVSHILVPRQDRLARPDNPIDGFIMEMEFRSDSISIVFMDTVLAPLKYGRRLDLIDWLPSMLAYDKSGRFRTELAQKIIHAKIELAERGFSIGGEPPYGFRRWLCSLEGVQVRELVKNEIVKMRHHHVVWLPTAEDEMRVVMIIFDLIATTPASRIATMLNQEGKPSPKAGQLRRVNNVLVPNSGLWTQTTIKGIARNKLYAALWEFGKRAMGDQLRFTPTGPRQLDTCDYDSNRKIKTISNPPEQMIVRAARFDPLIPPDRQQRIIEILDYRGRNLKGKARTRGNTPNTLGGRIHDLNCGWPMYRYAKRKKWCYVCALYQNSESKCCKHNVVSGEVASRFVVAALRQRLGRASVLASSKRR